MVLQVGNEITLWKVKYSTEAYTDQCNISHEGFIVKEEVSVKIVEEKEVPGDYSDKKYKGYKAVDKLGNVYLASWDIFPETLYNPYYYWVLYNIDHTDYTEYVDGKLCANSKGWACVKDNCKAWPINTKHCEVHNYCYYPYESNGCLYCCYEKD
jgi:hypothetical protein